MRRTGDSGFLWFQAVAGFALGLVAGIYLIRAKEIHFSKEIDPANLFNGVAILLVGFLIDYQYRRHQAAKRADTDLLLKDAHNAQDALRALRRAFEACTVCTGDRKLTEGEQTNLVSTNRQVSNAVKSLETGLNHCKVTLEDLGFEKLKEACNDLTEIVTYDPYPGPYEQRNLSKIERAFNAFEDELTAMPYKISRR
jgi:hypothetical protein